MSGLRLAAAVLLCASCVAAPATLVGTELDPRPAPDFTLTDGITGNVITLSAQQGRVVALAFLYTRCPDVCPLTAEQFRKAQAALTDDERGRVLFIAVSVDPQKDTPDAVQGFAREHGLVRNFAFLVGGATQLQPVWSAYGVGVVPDPSFPGHSDAIYLIDKKGRERVLTHSDIRTADLTRDLRMLAAER